MAKVSITKKIVEGNSQLAQLLAERNIKVGSKIESSELEELKVLAETTELVELTQEHFDNEPSLVDQGFKLGDKVRVAKVSIENDEFNNSSVQESDKNNTESSESFKNYVVKQTFKDKDNFSIIYKVGEAVPSDFDSSRIGDLLSRNLIQEA